jgi:hypothetical protein
MRLERAALVAAIIAILMAGWNILAVRDLQARMEAFSAGQSRTPPAVSTAPGLSTNIEQRVSHLEAINPSVAQTMLSIQAHTMKLHYAAEARNWGLARFEQGEIIEDLGTVAALKPEENGVSLVGIISAFTNTVAGPMGEMNDAIGVSDRQLFRKSYQDTILMCNACHQATGRPFIVITVPTNAPTFNQQWEPPK